jgi:hypothetical protein
MTRLVVEVEADDVELVFQEVVDALRQNAPIWTMRVTYDEPGEDPLTEVIEQ